MIRDSQKALKTLKLFQRALVFTAVIGAIGIVAYSTITLAARIAVQNNPMYETLHKRLEAAKAAIEAAKEAEKSNEPEIPLDKEEK